MRPLIRPRADWVGVIEALYAPEAETTAWLDGLFAAFEAILSARFGVGLAMVAHTDDYTNVTPVINGSNDPTVGAFLRHAGDVSGGGF